MEENYPTIVDKLIFADSLYPMLVDDMRTSRNAREGRFIGAWRGKAVRTRRRLFAGLPVDADVAWAVMSQRAKRPLPVRRPRYLSP